MKIILFILLLISPYVSARTIKVGKQYSFHSILSALSTTANGDTILVAPGIYHEKNLVIKNSVTLIGIDYPVLDGENKYEIISVKTNNVVIQGFKLVHSGISSIEDYAGIKVYNSKNVTIRNNILEDTFFGIYIQAGVKCTIEKNRLVAHQKEEQQSGNGINCWKSDSIHIIGNSITGHRDGIYFEFVTNSLIRGNISTKNLRYGLHFMFSHNDSYISNVFKNNGAGVAVMYTHHVKMLHNTFSENWGDASYGLMLKEISDSYIKGNHFSDNTTGIHMEGTSRIKIEKNVFGSNGWGMKIQASCIDNTITMNNFIANTFDISTNGTLVLNTFNNNYWDKYEGYDLNKDKIGDIPYHPLSIFSVIVEKNPPAMLLYRSFIITLIDKSEKIIPSLTPDNFVDNAPLMHSLEL